MTGLSSLGLSFAFASSAADACHEATQKAMVSFTARPELSVAIKGGIIAVVFLTTYFQQSANAWSQLVSTFSNSEFLIAWTVSGAINVSANFIMIAGMKRGQISDTVPFLSLSPVFLIPTGYIFLGETLDIRSILGVAAVAFGGLWLGRASAKTNRTALSSDVASNHAFMTHALPPGADLYIFIALLQSISSAFDKRGVRAAASPLLYGSAISSTVSLCSFLKFLWHCSKNTKEPVPNVRDTAHGAAEYRQQGIFCRCVRALPIFALTISACILKMSAYWCQLKASELLYSAQLSAIRKSGMLLVLLLGRVVFNEEVASKWLPVSTMLVGVGLLAAI